MKRFRQIIFLVFSSLALLLASCSFFDSEDENLSSKNQNISVVLSGKVVFFSADFSSSVSSSFSKSSRTILPSFPSSDLTYSVFASSDGGATKAAVAKVSSDGSYTIPIPTDGTYVIYAEISSSEGKAVYKGNSDPLTVSNRVIITKNGTTTEIGTITAKPFQSESGKGKAEIQVDVSEAEQIGRVKAEWKLSSAPSGSASSSFTKTISSSSGRKLTFHLTSDNDDGEVPSGNYFLALYFYSGSTDSIELYRVNEALQVYDNLTTNSCIGNASYFNGGKITITSSLISGTAYVVGTSATTLKTNPNGANGTYYAPYSSISDAVAKVTSSGSDTMTVYIDGTFDRAADGVLSLSVDSGKKLNIYGLDGADNSILKGSSEVGISVEKGSVNLKDITVSGCSSYGITNAGNLTLENCVITENIGGIFTSENISLAGKITVSENYTSSAKSMLENLSIASGKIIEIGGVFASDSKIGISLESDFSSGGKRTLTSGWKTYNPSTDASSFFYLDNDVNYSVGTDGEAIIGGDTYYVSSDGDDSASGSKTSPFKTLQKAVDTALALNNGKSDYKVKLLSDIMIDSSATFTSTSDNVSTTSDTGSTNNNVSTTSDTGSTNNNVSTPTLCNIKNTGTNTFSLNVLSEKTDSEHYAVSGDGTTIGRLFRVEGSGAAVNLSVDNLKIKNLCLNDSSSTKYYGSVLFMCGQNDTASFESGVTISNCVSYCSLFYPKSGTLTLNCTVNNNKSQSNGCIARLDGSGALKIEGGAYSDSTSLSSSSKCADLGLYGGLNKASTTISGGTLDLISISSSDIVISGPAYVKTFLFRDSNSFFTIGNTYTATDVSKIVYEHYENLSDGNVVFSIGDSSSLSISDVIGKFSIYDSLTADSPLTKYSLVADSKGKKALLRRIPSVSGGVTTPFGGRVAFNATECSSLAYGKDNSVTITATATSGKAITWDDCKVTTFGGKEISDINSTYASISKTDGAATTDGTSSTAVCVVNFTSSMPAGTYHINVNATVDGVTYSGTITATVVESSL